MAKRDRKFTAWAISQVDPPTPQPLPHQRVIQALLALIRRGRGLLNPKVFGLSPFWAFEWGQSALSQIPDLEKLLLLETAVEQADDAILITTAELDLPGPQIVFINPAFTKMTGYTPAEIIGQTPRILQGEKTDRDVLDRLRGQLGQGEPFYGEAINYRKDGSEYFLEWHIAPVRDGDGNVTHFVSIQRDATDRKKAEMALATVQKKRIEQLEAELGSLETMASNATQPPTNSGLSRRQPEVFQKLVERYVALLNLVVAERAYRIEGESHEHLQRLANLLGMQQATPRDVVDIHRQSLKMCLKDVHPKRAEAYLQEGRVVILELMGYVLNFYREGFLQRGQ